MAKHKNNLTEKRVEELKEQWRTQEILNISDVDDGSFPFIVEGEKVYQAINPKTFELMSDIFVTQHSGQVFVRQGDGTFKRHHLSLDDFRNSGRCVSYWRVFLNGVNYYVHALVAATFYPDRYIRKNFEAHHIGDSLCNDSEFITVIHKVQHNYADRGIEFYVNEPRINSIQKPIDDLAEYCEMIGTNIYALSDTIKHSSPICEDKGVQLYEIYAGGSDKPYIFTLCAYCSCINFEAAMAEVKSEQERRRAAKEEYQASRRKKAKC